MKRAEDNSSSTGLPCSAVPTKTSLVQRFWTQHALNAGGQQLEQLTQDSRWKTDTPGTLKLEETGQGTTTTTEHKRFLGPERKRRRENPDSDQKSCYERASDKLLKTPTGKTLSLAWTGTIRPVSLRFSSLSGLRSLRHHHDTTIKSNANLGRGRSVGKPLDLTLSRTHGDRRRGNPLKPPGIDHSLTTMSTLSFESF